jgi:uncharacterized protein (TIGR03437 family)
MTVEAAAGKNPVNHVGKLYNLAAANIAASVAGSVPGVLTHPAKPGDLVIVYATGLGAVDVPIADGQASTDQTRNTLIKPTVMVGGLAANVLFSGLTPQYPGVNQLNVIVPNAVPGDSVPIQIQVGGITTPVTTTMAVGQ